MIEVQCRACRNTFSTYPSANRKYCSWACRTEGIKGAGNPHAKLKIAKECATCGCAFEVYPSEAPTAGYCSKTCLGKANGRRIAAFNAKPPADFICEVCAGRFQGAPSTVGRKRFCSRQCAAEAMRTASDYKYGADWSRQRRAARARDCETCQCCGATGLIHVHHIVPYRISRSNELANLICLCPSCHTRIEAGLRAQERATKTAA